MNPRLSINAAVAALAAASVEVFPIERAFNLERFTYSDSGESTKILDLKGDTIDVIEIRVRGKVSVGGTAPSGPSFAGFANIIKRIEIRANDKDTFVSVTPMGATALTLIDDLLPQDTADVLVLATQTYEAVLKIDARQANTLMPNFTALDGRITGKIEMKLTFGGVERLFSTVESAVLSDVEIDTRCTGTKNSLMPKDMYMRSLTESRAAVERDGTEFVAFEVDRQDATTVRNIEYISGVLIMGVNGESIENVFNENEPVKVKFGDEVQRNYTFDGLRRMNRRRFNNVLPEGVYYIPFIENQDFRDAIPLTNVVGGIKVEMGVFEGANGPVEVRAIPNIIRRLKI